MPVDKYGNEKNNIFQYPFTISIYSFQFNISLTGVIRVTRCTQEYLAHAGGRKRGSPHEDLNSFRGDGILIQCTAHVHSIWARIYQET